MATKPALRSCCATTPSSMCFWTAVFLSVYGLMLLLRSSWPALNHYTGTMLLTALGVACLVNAARHRTYHCYITAPIFLAGAVVAALTESNIWDVRTGLLWGLVMIGVAGAFVAEWRASAPRPTS